MSLHILLDQNVPVAIVGFLLSNRPQWRVQHASQIGMSGAPDEEIFRWAQKHQAIVITFDEDFADTRMYPVGSHAGVIRLRVWPTTVEQTESALARVLVHVPDAELAGSLVIVDRNSIRIRRAARHS